MFFLQKEFNLPAIIVNVAICAVPLGYAFASLFHKDKLSDELRDASRNNLGYGIYWNLQKVPFHLQWLASNLFLLI